jgi:hypothetical protein
MKSFALLACVTALLVGCAGETDDLDADATESAIEKPKADLVFAGDKAEHNKDAEKPTGSLKGKKAGDKIKIAYRPQRIRGCDGGFWAQQTTVKFLDKKGREVGDSLHGSGFQGVGMVPKGKGFLMLSGEIPEGAVKLNLLTENDGGRHNPGDKADLQHEDENRRGGACSDTRDGKGWTIEF